MERVSSSAIEFIWLGFKRFSEEVLELLSCARKRRFTEDACCCLKAGLEYTEMCSSKCGNMTSEDDETVLNSDCDDEDDE